MNISDLLTAPRVLQTVAPLCAHVEGLPGLGGGGGVAEARRGRRVQRAPARLHPVELEPRQQHRVVHVQLRERLGRHTG